MGKFIVLEGSDCSGKSTQFNLLTHALQTINLDFRTITFPRYSEKSSELIKMYLNGDFGFSPTDVNAYAASTFYAVDRYAAYKTDFKEDYEKGTFILADRYTTSNAIHQASKLDGEEKNEYLSWLFHFEYNLLKLPAPNLVIFLDMPTEFALGLMEKREDKKDIHEMDSEYLKKCYLTSVDVCEKFNWKRISCVKEGKIRTIDSIHKEVLDIVLNEMKEVR